MRLAVTPRRAHLTARAVQREPIRMSEAWTCALIVDLVSSLASSRGFARIVQAATIPASAQVYASDVQRASIDTSATVPTVSVRSCIITEATVFTRFLIPSHRKRNRTKYLCVWAVSVWTATQAIIHRPSPSSAQNALLVATRIRHQLHALFVWLATFPPKPVASAKNVLLVNISSKMKPLVAWIVAQGSFLKQD